MVATNEAAYKLLSPQQKLATARLVANKEFPYFSAVLLGMIPMEIKGAKTLAVTDRLILFWGVEPIEKWSCQYLAGVLVHEAGHILRGHPARAKAIGVLPHTPQARLLNIAEDYEINDDLVKSFPCCFSGEVKHGPAGALPKNRGFQNGLMMEEYYQKLRELAESEQQGGVAILAGQCGSAAGNPTEDEPASEGEGEGRTEGEIERIRVTVAQEIKDHASKFPGTVPGSWQRWAESALKPPKVRWQDKLARLTRGAIAWKSGNIDLRYTHLSRRQWGIGIGPGKPMLPALRAPVPSIACVIDTSASMGEDALTIALRETRGVLQAVGSRVTFCACDAAVHELRPISDWREVPKLLVGGGGTDFNPAFEALSRHKQRPDVVVFVTDGFGPCPPEAPQGMKVIWLLTPGGQKPCNWGEHIVMEN